MACTKTLTHNNQSFEIVILELADYLDRSSLETTTAEVDGLLHTGRRYLILEMEKVTGLSEGGIAVLIELLSKILQNEGLLLLAAVSPEVLHRLRILKLEKIFDIYSTKNKAFVAASQWLTGTIT